LPPGALAAADVGTAAVLSVTLACGLIASVLSDLLAPRLFGGSPVW